MLSLGIMGGYFLSSSKERAGKNVLLQDKRIHQRALLRKCLHLFIAFIFFPIVLLWLMFYPVPPALHLLDKRLPEIHLVEHKCQQKKSKQWRDIIIQSLLIYKHSSSMCDTKTFSILSTLLVKMRIKTAEHSLNQLLTDFVLRLEALKESQSIFLYVFTYLFNFNAWPWF